MSREISHLSIVVCGDRKDYLDQEYGPHIWRILADSGFVEGKSIGGVGFCRDFENDRLITVLPKAFSSSSVRNSFSASEYIKKQIYQLIRVFNKLNRSDYSVTNSDGGDTFSNKGSDPVLNSLEAALKIRSEYRTNGLYYKKRKIRQLSKINHQINWPSTISRRLPVLDDEGIFYPSMVHNSRAHNLQHPMSDLHLSCLREILRLVGDKSLSSLPETSFNKSLSSIKKPKNYIRDISHDVFDERGRKLAKLMEVYLGHGRLQSSAIKRKDDLLGYTANFEIVWESILRSLFDRGKSRILPKGQWFAYQTPLSETSGISPVIDGEMSSDACSAYIDAKDYRVKGGLLFGSPNDHYKQVIYRLLTDPDSPDNFFNILVFPGIGQDGLFKIHGCHKWAQIPNSTVYEVSVDYELAVSRWLGDLSFSLDNTVKKLLMDLSDFEARVRQGKSIPL
jgi:hypothetical protein